MTPVLSFVLSNEGVLRVYDAVLCLAKFGEVVSLDACRDKVSWGCVSHPLGSQSGSLL